MVEGLGLLFPSASELRLRVESRLRDVAPPDGNNSQFSTFNFQFTELTDQHVNSLYCRFCLDTGRQAKISDFYIIIESDFYPEYHPLKEYLESLPAWDGMTDHIDQLAVQLTGINDPNELAMPLSGTAEEGASFSGFGRSSFIEAMASTEIATKIAEKIIDKLIACRDKWFALIDASFLTDDLKEAYKALLTERLERL